MSSHPLCSMRSLTLLGRCAPRLSITTTCPGLRAGGASKRSTYVSNTRASLAPSTATEKVPSSIDARQQRRVLATVCGDLEDLGSLAYGRIGGIQRSQGGVGTYLVHEHHQVPRIDTTHLPMRHRLLKNSSLSAAPVDLFFGSCALAPPPDIPSLRTPKPPRAHTGTRLFGSE